MRKLLALLVLLALLAGGAWLIAGRAAGPIIDIAKPGNMVGQSGELSVLIDRPLTALSRLDIVLEQDGQTLPIFSLPGDASTKVTSEGEGEAPRKARLTRDIGKRSVPQLKAGKTRLIVTAERPVLFGYRHATSTQTKELDVRLTPPRVGVISLHHFINHGGSELVVYSVTPADVQSGVRVGDKVYPGYPASHAGVAGANDSLKVAFFALLHDQDVNTPISVFARDAAGNEAKASFEYRVFPKAYRQSRIEVDDRFLARVVPAILSNTPDLKVDRPDDLVSAFLTINRDLRQRNNATIAGLASKTADRLLWKGPFKQLSNSAVESSFADQRTYFYNGQEIDKQVHLGFDLASTSAAPVQASNEGVVIRADYLGIYGNCVIVDHGLGLQSLYAHLSTIDVKVDDAVKTGQALGRSGATGLAGGDHLHFTMLLGGHAVTPVDWWSVQWVEDRIMRKLREAGTPATPTAPTSATQ